MIEHVNNLVGLQNSGNELLQTSATLILEQWNKFATGLILREEFCIEVDKVWTPEKNQELIDSGADGRLIHFANFVFNGIKDQNLDL